MKGGERRTRKSIELEAERKERSLPRRGSDEEIVPSFLPHLILALSFPPTLITDRSSPPLIPFLSQPDMVIEIGILILFLLLLLTVFGLLAYCGLFQEIDVKVGPSPVPFSGRTVVYKTARGDYSKSGHTFTELTGDLVRIRPDASDLTQIGFYFDDPETRLQPDRLRYAAGAILPEDDADMSHDIVSGLQAKGYQSLVLPVIDHVVHASFPNRGPIAIVIGTKRVYPAIRSFITDHKLCAHPALEIYTSDYIYFILPLSKQDGFYLFDEEDEEEEEEGDTDGGSGDEEDEEEDEGSESERCSNSEAEHEDSTMRLPKKGSDAKSESESRKASSSSFEEIHVPEPTSSS